jgi:beta-glucosidase-like glycosyl hydrolase
MCSYNLINGEWSCQNNETLNTDLKERLGFKRFVMSCVGSGPAVTAAAHNVFCVTRVRGSPSG